MELLECRIYLIRGQKVMLDADLAELYRVPTKRLNRAVKRNHGWDSLGPVFYHASPVGHLSLRLKAEPARNSGVQR